MPRFNFRLEPLLDLRKRAERQEQLRVAEIQQEATRLLARIQQYQNDISGENLRLTGEKLIGRLDLTFIAHEKRYVHTLQVLIVNTMQKLAAVDRSLAAARANLLAAAKARKAIERLREKQFRRWQEDQDRKETAAIDEIGTQLALRQREEVAGSQ